MRHNNPASSNLLSRLFRYIPSEGEKQNRHPLEDFCTEALAWNLIHSAGFREKFITSLRIPYSPSAPVHIHTQYPIDGGRVDLRLEIGEKPWNGEVKIRADLSKAQKDYAHFLLVPQSEFPRYKAAFPENFPIIAWETVHQLLVESSRASASRDAGATISIMSQFADFLEEKGFKSIPMKTDLYSISGPAALASALDEITKLLNKLKTTLGIRLRGDPPPKWLPPEYGNKLSYYGIYGAADQYAGIEFDPNGKVHCYYQEKFFGRPPEPGEHSEGDTGVVFRWNTDTPGETWINATIPYPKGSHDKGQELEEIFAALQRSLGGFAVKHLLRPALQTETENTPPPSAGGFDAPGLI